MNDSNPDFDKVYQDFCNLCKTYVEEMPLATFGYAIISCASKMLLDIAPNKKVAIKTINAGINAGREWHLEDAKKGGYKQHLKESEKKKNEQ